VYLWFSKGLMRSNPRTLPFAQRTVPCICFFLKGLAAPELCFTMYLWFSKRLSRIGPRILPYATTYLPCYE
jgi:hypothetical protein